ncbi:hypothetical protein [Gottfriedia luciferensis]|uniref:hypothetical protein n=1 Tax=Gottfriedia luciferensis TaxID=178774 RepID=UPI000B442911|nr:hypothetical protein [Gottfriedia luciferensis]
MKNDDDFQSLLNDFNVIINKNVRKVTPINQDDLSQEIKILMYEKFLNINNIIAEPPGFFDFIKNNN